MGLVSEILQKERLYPAGKKGFVLPKNSRISGLTKSSQPTKHAEGFPDKPKSNFPSNSATVVTLPGRIFILLNRTLAPNLS